MSTSISFVVEKDGCRILVRRRYWDGVDRPEHDTLYTIETIAEAESLYRQFGDQITKAKDNEVASKGKRLQEVKAKISELDLERHQLINELNRISRP